MSLAGQRWWLIGASEGLGRALAEALAQEGAEVIVSARSADRLAEVADALPGGRAVAMDVTDAASVQRAATEVGQVDGMVYLAAAYWPMQSKDWDTDKAVAMIDVNLSGAVRAVGAVLPAMLARNAGRIVLTGSLAGFRGLPGTIGYAASKSGLMNLAESMQSDLHTTGVHVQLINPGYIHTRLTEMNDFSMPFIMEPQVAAQHMLHAIKGRRAATSFPMLFSWLFRGGRFLPTALWHRLFASV